MKRLSTLLAAACLTACATPKVPPLPPAPQARRAVVAPSVSLIWNASPSTDVTGYALYHGLGGSNATLRVDVGLTTQAILGNLTMGATNYIYCTAYNAEGAESVPSNTLAYTPAQVLLIFQYTLQNWLDPGWTNIGGILLTNPPGDVGIFRVQMDKL